MIADKIIVQDGQTYQPGEEVPDLGSLEAYASEGNIRNYNGFSKDVDKLPHYVGANSTCFMLDTGDYYKYHEKSDTWIRI